MASEPIARPTPPAVGMKDIAERLGVSIGTVDRALNGKPGINPDTCAHVLAVAHSLGYRPNLAARYLRSRRPVRISVHLPGGPSLFWDTVRDGLREAAEPLAPSLVIEPLAHPDVEDGWSDDADGLIVADLTDPAVAAYVEGALGRGVPVACVGIDAPSDPRILSICADPFSVGALAGELVGRFLPNGGQVALVADSVATRAHSGHVGGFVSSLSTVSPLSALNAIVETDADRRENRRRLRKMLSAHPRLKAVCITAADALTVLRVLEQERPVAGIHVVVTDLAPELFDDIRRGTIAAAIYQRPFMQGRLALQLLHQQIQTRALPAGHRRNVAPYAVMRSNLDLVFEHAPIAKPTRRSSVTSRTPARMAATTFAALAAAGMLAATAAAQEPGARRTDAPVSSPEVASDRRVTFRLLAPEAKAVTVSGDFGPDAGMRKGEDGVWSATVGPLDPEMYVYYFTVDGVRLTDPNNPQVKIGYVTTTTTSLLTVPGNGPAFYDVQRVPHGEIRTLLYESKSNGVTRELTVYVPPGYDQASERRYPVLYLLHGFANDHHSWHRYGRANDILDNLLAKGAIAPFLVVMPLGYGGARVNGDGTGIAPEGSGTFRGDPALYERDLLEDIIPMIDGKYRTIADRKHRAIVGFSMGGGQAGRYGLRHLETFSTVGIMSAGLGGGGNTAAPGADPVAALAADPAKANEQIDLLWIACGKEDAAMKGAAALHEALGKAGIEHTFLETEGAHHWRVWRRYLRDLAPLLFK